MSRGPLDGLSVVDLSRLLPGPLTAKLLGDLGARVLKVEEPSLGDPVRLAPPFIGDTGTLAALLLSGVESVALDLKRRLGREVLLGLLEDADVLLESFRPGTLARLGLEPGELRLRFPQLVICSLSGWGQDGPWAERPGHDLTYQAAAGSLAPTGSMPAVPVADVVGAWSAVAGVLAALLRRERTGEGGWIDQGLCDAAAHANLASWAAESGSPHGVGDPMALSGALPCYQLYRTRDGELLAVGALERRFWRRFCRAIGRPDLDGLQYDESPLARERVAAVMVERTREEWMELLAGHDVPVEPVLAPAAALEHPQLSHRGVVRRGSDGALRLAYPARFDGARPGRGERVPEPGEDTEQVLAEHQLPRDRRSGVRLRALGVGPRRSLRRWLAGWVARRQGL